MVSARSRFVAVCRRALLWGIPLALLSAIVYSALPHRAPAPPRPPASGSAPGAGTRVPAPPRSASPPPPRQEPSSAGLSGRLVQGTLVDTDSSGRPRWRIAADDVLLQQGGRIVVLRHVRATFYGEGGTTMTVTAGTGRYDTKTRVIALDGDVHGRSSTGRELYADHLVYSPGSARIVGTGHIRVVETRVTMYADRMESNVTLGETRFYGHVRMAFQP
jgi:LPS export ABC transporter protein LptC